MEINDALIDISKLDNKFLNKLAMAQKICTSQFIITSGFRTPEEDIAAGASGHTAHTRGLAVDLRCRTSGDRYAIIRALLAAGFDRIGDEVDHIHVDIDKSLAPMVIFRE